MGSDHEQRSAPQSDEPEPLPEVSPLSPQSEQHLEANNDAYPTEAQWLRRYSFDTLTNSRPDRPLLRGRGLAPQFWWRAVQRQWRVWRADTFGTRQTNATSTFESRIVFVLAVQLRTSRNSVVTIFM